MSVSRSAAWSVCLNDFLKGRKVLLHAPIGAILIHLYVFKFFDKFDIDNNFSVVPLPLTLSLWGSVRPWGQFSPRVISLGGEEGWGEPGRGFRGRVR